ncbi:MAG TPA: hypothetical protein VET85_00090 [Stellaceae bacterium]|nr:hypothetical protein [Stellaceae bacterium]
MTKTFNLLSRTAIISGIVAFAALPALAQNSQPAAPATSGAATQSMSTEKPAGKLLSGDADHKGDMKADKSKVHAEGNKDKDKAKTQSATAPAAKKADEAVKTPTTK